MRPARLSVFLIAMILLVSSGMLIAAQVTARTAIPDRLEIMRTTGHGNTPAHEMTTQAQLVQDLYHTMLALPIAPAEEICPQYIIANYRLTFYAHNVVMQKANALRGLCQPVTLGSNDIRTANAKFWTLMNKAMEAGKPVTTFVGTPTSTPVGISTSTPTKIPTPTPTKISTPTPVATPTVYIKR